MKVSKSCVIIKKLQLGASAFVWPVRIRFPAGCCAAAGVIESKNLLCFIMSTAEEIIEFLGMKPLPGEGGYYVETYRCSEKISPAALPTRYSGARSFGTAILYVLTAETFSAMHRVRSDEIYHFYLGDPVTMLQLYPDGTSEVIILGRQIFSGQQVQVTVPKNSWQGSFVSEGGEFALLGTTVAPGFEFTDFELGQRGELLKQYPNKRDLIVKLTQAE